MSKVNRLFQQFAPQEYILSLHPDIDSMSFKGKITITGKKTGKPSQRLTFHQKDLIIKSANIYKISGAEEEPLAIDRFNTHNKYDELRLHTNDTIYPGQYKIDIEFEGKITRPMHGLYPCFFDSNGKKNVLLATQFESHHAREVFPCIDEPEAKAIFKLSLTSSEEYEVISNTTIKDSRNLPDGLKEVTFNPTPKMSSYLLAFVIGDIHRVHAKTRTGIEMSTWASTAQPKEFLEYANQEAVKILDFFTDYFGTDFPLEKCDQIALPDFESGAMENWGLITYREIALLADPKNRSLTSEQYVSMVVAHELSHQWFGNLVTMKWWDNLWLNESFASLMEHVALDKLHPEWAQWEQYTAADVISSSSRDIYKDVQSVQVDVNHPDEISTLFDPAIVYAKGGRLLKMMMDYIGEDAFKIGLKSYFKKYAYKNTVGDDLWSEMSAASGKNISDFMNPWISQSGMPLITAELNNNTLNLSQRRFILDKEDDKSLWPIPLLANTALEKDILNKESDVIELNSDKRIVLNTNGSAHAVIHYIDETLKSSIIKAFIDQSLTASGRINLLNDMHLLSRKGEASIIDSLELIKSASNEPRDAVWLSIGRSISTAVGLVEGDEDTELKIKEFRKQLILPLYEKLGWEDRTEDDPNTKALRQTVLSMMIASEHNDAVDQAVKLFNSADTLESLPAEQRSLIIGANIRTDSTVVKRLIKEYKSTSNPEIQLAICSGLTSTKDKAAAKLIIEQSLGDDGFVRPQDIFRWFAYLMRNKYSRELAWEWLVGRWDSLEDLFGDSKSFEYFVNYSAQPINTPDWQSKFTDFFSQKEDIIALRRNIKIAYSEIDARVSWRNREEPLIKKYFQ